jgi:GDP-L-fucose synthase
MNKNSVIWVAGHKGLVGSAIVRKLKDLGYTNIVKVNRGEVDLLNFNEVDRFFRENKPEYVFLAAAKVGGIKANSDYKADFIYENIMIQSNVIKCSQLYRVKKMIFLGSSCIYPKLSQQPIKEEYLLSGYLESSNDAYAIAKIAGIKMCQSFNQQYGTNFISVMPCNMYGINDNYHPQNSHVFPAIIKKLHDAKVGGTLRINLWGDGSPYREFLFSDDLADACHFLMMNDSPDLVNIGSGKDQTIKDLACLMRDIIYPNCQIVFDGNENINGTPKKLLDVSLINKLGWESKTSLEDGIRLAYKDFLNRYESID